MPPPSSALRDLARRGAEHSEGAAERCDLCSEPLAASHRHLVDLSTKELSCACPACGVLFDHHAGGGRYRLIRTRPRRLDDELLSDLMWASLEIPVDLAFFVRDGTHQVTAFYPNPIGTMRTSVDAETWNQVAETNAAISTLETDVEALLVNRVNGTRQHWLMPLDECYRLVSIVRTHWTGFTGGTEVWQRVESFFAELSRTEPTQGGQRVVTDQSWR